MPETAMSRLWHVAFDDDASKRQQGLEFIISAEPRINDEIRVPQVRLIGPNSEQVGVIATSVALNLAKEANLDLVEVAPNAKPPVAKLIDYGKYKYNEKIKQREAR
ncbi:translation initiation factor IF-3, partial [Bifidobacterium commune]|nr:translation initiation factor IF-3 [Bifidobacterium commune]